MKKHDFLTTIGIVAGFGLTLWGMASGGTNLIIFYDPASIAITVGGSFAALLIAYPISEMKKVIKVIVQSFKENTCLVQKLLIALKTYLKRQEEKDFYLLKMKWHN